MMKISFSPGMVYKRIYKISTLLTLDNSQISQNSSPIKAHQLSYFFFYQTLFCITRHFFFIVRNSDYNERNICHFRVELLFLSSDNVIDSVRNRCNVPM